MRERIMETQNMLTPERVLEELVMIGFARITDFLYVEDGAVKLKALDGQSGAAIAGIERTTHGPKIKLYDKMKALELLGKHMGMFDGSGRQEKQENNLLQAILEAAKKEVDTSDIPELQQAAAAGNDLVEQNRIAGI